MCGIGLFSYFTYFHLENFVSGRHIVDGVNNTPRNKGGGAQTVQSDTF